MIFERTEKIVVASEEFAKNTVEEYRKQANANGTKIKKASIEYKCKKSKGEIVAECWICIITEVLGDIWEEME